MYKNQKIIILILEMGVLLGSLGGKSFAEPGTTYTWNNGGEHTEENGISGDDFWLLIDNVTTLTGNATVEPDGMGRLVVNNSSIWKGDLKIEEGYATGVLEVREDSFWQGDVWTKKHSNSLITLMESEWQGSVNSKGVSQVLADNSHWTGDFVGANANENPHTFSQITLVNNSIWIGSLNFQNDQSTPHPMYVSVVSSNWNGNVTAVTTNTPVYMDITLSSSNWTGDIQIHGGVNESSQGALDLTLWDSQWGGTAFSEEVPICVNAWYGGTWFMTGDSQIRELSIRVDSEVIFVNRPGAFSTLTVEGDLDAHDARFRMNTDLAANVGDLLDVKGVVWDSWGGGEPHKISVNNQGGAWVNPSNELTIVKTGGTEDGQFELDNGVVEVGGFKYGLKRVGNDWNLYTTGRTTTTASASLNAFVGSYLLNYAENQTLLKRLGDLRGGSEKNGIWSRVYGGEFESRGNHFLRGFDMNYSGVQVGYDQKRGSNYFGGMFGYTKGNLDHGAGSGSVDSKSLGAYWTHLSPNGFYADVVLKYGWMNHDFKVLDSSGATIKGDDIDTSGWSGSLEVGKRIYLDSEKKDRWYLEPQAQLTVSQQNGESFTASNGLQIQVDSLKSVLGRIGLNVGYEVKSGKSPIHLYGKVSYLHEFEGDIGVSYNGIRATEHLGENWWSYGVGATAQLGKNHRLYLDIERADGARFRQPWAMSGGYRFSW